MPSRNLVAAYPDFFKTVELQKGQHVMLHSAFRQIRKAFPHTRIKDMLAALQAIITPAGSLIMPTFTYCFKKSQGYHDVYDPIQSPSKVGAVSEVFRKMPAVVRTASPTHSFALWGEICHHISSDNAPQSPLGKNSVLDWLTAQPNTFILLLGADFSSLSYLHYLEVKAPVPWHDYSPWDYMHVEKTGVSVHGEQKLKQIPGCARSFTHFEQYLIHQNLISKKTFRELTYYFIPVKLLYAAGIPYFRKYPHKLLCPGKSCPACQARRSAYQDTIKALESKKD